MLFPRLLMDLAIARWVLRDINGAAVIAAAIIVELVFLQIAVPTPAAITSTVEGLYVVIRDVIAADGATCFDLTDIKSHPKGESGDECSRLSEKAAAPHARR
jgi:hypothetical protein